MIMMEIGKMEAFNVSDVGISILRRFRCSEVNLSSYLKDHAIKLHHAGAGHSTVVVDTDNNIVIGYFTLKCSSTRVFDKEMDDEAKHVPTIEIVKFAINREHEKRGVGRSIFSFALKTIDEIRNDWVGAQMITLFALPNVTGFYEKFDFKVLDKTMSTYACRENEGCVCMYCMLRKDFNNSP